MFSHRSCDVHGDSHPAYSGETSHCGSCGVTVFCGFSQFQLWVASHPCPCWEGCLLEALKPWALMPYFSSYIHSAGVPLAPFLWELYNYCQGTSKWKESPQTVSGTTIAANKIGWIHEVVVFNSSLLLSAMACGMAAQQQGRSCF